MILTDSEILKGIEAGDIVISPFDPLNLGSNSYDVHLSDKCKVYTRNDKTGIYLDAKEDNPTVDISPDGGKFYLGPNKVYLMSTIEYTETHKHVPFLEGKSSTGRLGVSIHATAGKGDVGFCGHWTLEITVAQEIILYVGMPIGQLIYFETKGDCINPYNKKKTAKYNKQGIEPVSSQMWKNFENKEKKSKILDELTEDGQKLKLDY